MIDDDAAQCGTVRGYLFHLWVGSCACTPCVQAHASFSVRGTAYVLPLPTDAAGGHIRCKRCRELKPNDAYSPRQREQKRRQTCRACIAKYERTRRDRKKH